MSVMAVTAVTKYLQHSLRLILIGAEDTYMCVPTVGPRPLAQSGDCGDVGYRPRCPCEARSAYLFPNISPCSYRDRRPLGREELIFIHTPRPRSDRQDLGERQCSTWTRRSRWEWPWLRIPLSKVLLGLNELLLGGVGHEQIPPRSSLHLIWRRA
jgi:hypothetical protein